MADAMACVEAARRRIWNLYHYHCIRLLAKQYIHISSQPVWDSTTSTIYNLVLHLKRAIY